MADKAINWNGNPLYPTLLKDISSGAETAFAVPMVQVDATGAIIGSGSGGDASAANQVAEQVLIGAVNETAPASDTANSGLNGRLQRIAQRITSLIALVPASLGSKAAASSFAVTDSTEDLARMGIVTETAPASDTASSGLNGRLQRIAQRLTSLIALSPASLGQKAMSASFATVIASDQSAIPTSIGALASTGGISVIGRFPTSAATTNATRVKGTAGRLYSVKGRNTAAYDVFLTVYDSAANPPVPGTTTIFTKWCIPAGSAFVFDWAVGLEFTTGIGFAFVKNASDADTTAIAAGDIVAFSMEMK